MNEELTRTSTKQRIIIGLIAAFMLFATVAVYAFIVLNGETTAKREEENSAKLAEAEEKLTALQGELEKAETDLSNKHFSTLNEYRSRVKSYNATSVNDAGLQTEDLKTGNGAEIKEDTEYTAYYIGWCADESIFDSSFDDKDKPTKLKGPLVSDKNSSFISGWKEGVIGMKIGGVREIHIPGELAYGDTKEICGGKNSPLKFIIYTIDPGEEYQNKVSEYNTAYYDYMTLYYSTQK